jgi:hypothetical protein
MADNNGRGGADFPDPFELWKKMYFVAEDALGATVRQMIGTTAYSQLHDQMLNQYLLGHKLYQEFMEKSTEQTPFASKQDVARVAEMLVGLEDKLEMMESQLEQYLLQVVQVLALMTKRIERQTADPGGDTATDSPAVPEELAAIEDKLGTLEKRIAKLDKTMQSVVKMLPAKSN